MVELVIAVLVFIIGMLLGRAGPKREAALFAHKVESLEKKAEDEAAKRAEWAEKAKQNDVRDYDNQLRFIEASSLSKQKIMNKKEFLVFKSLEEWIAKDQSGRRVFCQVSMGEILSAPQGEAGKKAYGSINSKRCDFVIVEPYGLPEFVVEYQGSGHNQDDYEQRDAVKAAALKKAGIPLVEVFPGKEGYLDVAAAIEGQAAIRQVS